MKRRWAFCVSAALAAVWSAGWSQISFVHVATVDLSPYFPNGGQQGNSVSDVAFDGTNLYLAGFSTVFDPATQPVGVVRVENALSPNRAFTPLISLMQASQSRVSYVVYRDGYLYLGTGLGDGSNSASNTGIRQYDAATGTQITTWNSGGSTPGVVLPSDLSNSSRAECIELDPGYQGSNPSLAVLARGRGFIFRRNLVDGSALANILSPPSRDCQGGATTTGMRDITFSPEGDAYLRVDNSVFYAQRTADNTVDSNRACRILDFESDNAFQVLINIHYLRVGGSNYLILNRRTGADPRINKVLIYTGGGASWTPYAELNGDEPIGSDTPAPFGTDIFNFTTGYGPDPSKGDVNLDGLVDDADLLGVLFAFGGSGGTEDVNGDGVVDDADLLTVLFNFGSNPQALYLFVVSSQLTQSGTNDRLDIYRVEPSSD
ncbi:hypothetical protein DCOP10_12083 [Armatimonadetes bacterium DC]|nr:hypothetical protein DCOP10_12083 [Armatimonadetes bacterium DC]